ncbi:MAG: transcriptional regulator [Phycisphaerales bacterium]|jgi:CheY-like chemotaxis protein|nr:transcriptional regulator [Phycisphaerales bacterium]
MRSILIVDDAEDASEPLARYLDKIGYRVRRVPDGREALVQVIAVQPDAVLLDLYMPNMDGPTFLNLVRSYLRLQSLPVVVLTAFPESPLADAARSLNASTVLVKGTATFEDIKTALDAAITGTPASSSGEQNSSR